MKAKSPFTLYGLDVKAIQKYIKAEAKAKRRVIISRHDDNVYLCTNFLLIKLPRLLYADAFQPATMCSCPDDGHAVALNEDGIFAQDAIPAPPDTIKLLDMNAYDDAVIERTPFSVDLRCDDRLDTARVFHAGEVPIIVNTKYDEMFDPDVFTYHGKASSTTPIHAYDANTRSYATVEAILLPIHPKMAKIDDKNPLYTMFSRPSQSATE